MEHDLVVEGRVVGPSGTQEIEVGVSAGRIAEVRKQGLKGTRRIKAGRCLVFPGFIDIHVHMREPGWEKKEDFRTGTEAAIHGGVTTVVDMPNNPMPATSPAVVEEKKRLASSKAVADVEFYGGVDAERLDDLGELAGHVVGYKLYLARTTGDLTFPSDKLRRAFDLISKTGKPVSVHCEEQSIVDERTKELAGEKRGDAYCDMRPPRAEVESVKRVEAALRGVKGLRANVCHASTAETLSIVGEGRARGSRIDCEAALHHLYFNRKAMLENRLLRTNPPLRDEGDRAALVQGVKDGGVSFLVTDHAPHTEEEKLSQGLAGVPGLDDYGHLVSWLIRSQGVDPVVIARVACSNPAGFVGLGDRGEVAVGMRADLTVLDLHSPEKVRRGDVRSKCGWSPYEGKEFPGRVRWTLRDGEVLLDEYEPVT